MNKKLLVIFTFYIGISGQIVPNWIEISQQHAKENVVLKYEKKQIQQKSTVQSEYPYRGVRRR